MDIEKIITDLAPKHKLRFAKISELRFGNYVSIDNEATQYIIHTQSLYCKSRNAFVNDFEKALKSNPIPIKFNKTASYSKGNYYCIDITIKYDDIIEV